MSYLATKLAIEEYFKTSWVDGSAEITPIRYANQEAGDVGDEWVRIVVRPGDAKQVSMGDDPGFRIFGTVFVQIFVRKDTGEARALELADTVDQLFRRKILDKMQFRMPQVDAIPSPNSEFYQVNVSTDFFRG